MSVTGDVLCDRTQRLLSVLFGYISMRDIRSWRLRRVHMHDVGMARMRQRRLRQGKQRGQEDRDAEQVRADGAEHVP